MNRNAPLTTIESERVKVPQSILVTVVVSNLTAAAYDPLALPPAAAPEPLELVVHDAGRDRDLPLRVYLPASTNPAPVVLFSHGLGGNRHGSAFLGRHWSARGYVVVFLQHPGSDDSVWKDKPLAQRDPCHAHGGIGAELRVAREGYPDRPRSTGRTGTANPGTHSGVDSTRTGWA